MHLKLTWVCILALELYLSLAGKDLGKVGYHDLLAATTGF